MNKTLLGIIRLLIVFAMPIFLALTAARVMVADWYPKHEYVKPDFPPDTYGFTTEQRLERGLTSIHFLNDPRPADQAIVLLDALRLPGTDKVLFNQYERSHMMDVKRFIDLLWRVLAVSALIVVGGLALLLARHKTRADGYAAIFVGGALTTGLLGFLVAFVLVGWRTFFIGFHELFFQPGSWTFDWSDSLIRLFPDKFWFDAGFILTGGTLAAGVVVMGIGYGLGRRARRA
ncbi:MAG: TIGR01906 family membrane protein [Chloroflexi bacterium]|nr:TIGR01906 family membrane protein [Chloroflexota bacterium]